MKPLQAFTLYYGTLEVDTLQFHEHQTVNQMKRHRQDLVAQCDCRADRAKLRISRFTFIEQKSDYDTRTDTYGPLKTVARFNHFGEEIAV